MDKPLRWYDHITINIYWLGINIASGSITPVILPYLVALFVPANLKNTYLGNLRVISLAVAMMVQPVAGTLSDRSTSRWGRRRPFIFLGTLFNLVFLIFIGLSPRFADSTADPFFQRTFGASTAYLVLVGAIVLLQTSSNFAQGALQGLIPDLVPEEQRGRSSGVKAVMELLPVFLIILVGPLLDRGLLWVSLAIVAAAFLITMVITVLFVHEEPLRRDPGTFPWGKIARLLALTLIFVTVTQGSLRLVRWVGTAMGSRGAPTAHQVIVVGFAGLLAMAGSILLGVYFGAWVGIGRGAQGQTSFIWWVVNRLLYLAAVGSIQGFSLFYLQDVLGLSNAATWTTILSAVVAVFLLPSALAGGYLADGNLPLPSGRGLKRILTTAVSRIVARTRLHRMGRKGLVGLSGGIATVGALLLLLARGIPMVMLSGCFLGLATGIFFATSWALGTDLAPKPEAGRYMGISNLAGAGAGIVGAGIGGPMADFFNELEPGLGYLVIFAIFAGLFLLSVATLARVQTDPGKVERLAG